jgi:hypothetical protein
LLDATDLIPDYETHSQYLNCQRAAERKFRGGVSNNGPSANKMMKLQVSYRLEIS